MARKREWLKIRTGLLTPEHLSRLGGCLGTYLWLHSEVPLGMNHGLVRSGEPITEREIAEATGTSPARAHDRICKIVALGYLERVKIHEGSILRITRYSATGMIAEPATETIASLLPERYRLRYQNGSDVLPKRYQCATKTVAHHNKDRARAKKDRKNRERKKQQDALNRNQSDSQTLTTETEAQPETKRETKILNELYSTPDFETLKGRKITPKRKPSTLTRDGALLRLRKLTNLYPNTDLLRIARETGRYVESEGIYPRTFARFENDVERKAKWRNKLTGIPEYVFDPELDATEEIKLLIHGDICAECKEPFPRRGDGMQRLCEKCTEAEREQERESERKRNGQEHDAGHTEDKGLGEEGAGEDPGRGSRDNQVGPEDRLAAQAVQSLVAGTARRMGRGHKT